MTDVIESVLGNRYRTQRRVPSAFYIYDDGQIKIETLFEEAIVVWHQQKGKSRIFKSVDFWKTQNHCGHNRDSIIGSEQTFLH